MKPWTEGAIEGVTLRPATPHADARGWLTEIYRSDEVDAGIMPAMGYVALTKPGVARGPHEHVEQTDIFGFVGPGRFLIRLWDNRPASPTHGHRMSAEVGTGNPMIVIVPPHVVHGYRNISSEDGYVLNFPNRLFKGPGRKAPVDEVRYEAAKDSPFTMD